MSLFHPTARMPLWLALALPLAAYLYRSVMRGFDFAPDLPIDALVLAIYLLVLGAAISSRRTAAKTSTDDASEQQGHEDHRARDGGDDEEVLTD